MGWKHSEGNSEISLDFPSGFYKEKEIEESLSWDLESEFRNCGEQEIELKGFF